MLMYYIYNDMNFTEIPRAVRFQRLSKKTAYSRSVQYNPECGRFERKSKAKSKQ
jgi:hypothetical protein